MASRTRVKKVPPTLAVTMAEEKAGQHGGADLTASRMEYCVQHYYVQRETMAEIGKALGIGQPAVSNLIKKFLANHEKDMFMMTQEARMDYVLHLQEHRRDFEQAYARSVQIADQPVVSEYAKLMPGQDGQPGKLEVVAGSRVMTPQQFNVPALRGALATTERIAKALGVDADSGQVEVQDTGNTMSSLTPEERQQAMLAALLTIAAKGQEILEAQERAEAAPAPPQGARVLPALPEGGT